MTASRRAFLSLLLSSTQAALGLRLAILDAIADVRNVHLALRLGPAGQEVIAA